MLIPTVTDYQQNFKATEKGLYESENAKLFSVLSISDFSSRSIFCISKVVVNADKITVLLLLSILSTYISNVTAWP